MKKARSFLAATAAVLALLASGASASAATASATPQGQGNGLKISPVRTDLTIEKGGSRQVQLFVENVTAFPMKLKGVTNDFVASDDESGEPRIILDDDKSAPEASFKSLINSLPSVSLQPKERKQVNITLSVPKNAASGGYYGAVRFIPDNGPGDKNVSLNASVGSIFLITVPGNLVQQLKIESFDVTHNKEAGVLFNSGPVSVVTRFRNFGNVHVQPFGHIEIKDFRGNTVQTIEINNTQPRGNVLPNSVRKFENAVSQKKLFGRYTVEGSFGYGDKGELLLAKKTFYVIPYKYIAGVILLLAFLIFVLPRLIRAYNRSIVQRAQAAQGSASVKAKPKPRPRSKPKK
jgi:hypothetical protein